MKRVSAIVRREYLSYFKSPIGYIVLAMFVLVTSFVFVMDLQAKYSDVGTVLMSVQTILFMVIIPMITMRSFSEERKGGTEVLLLTSPASVFEIVMGKFLASLGLLLTMTATSVVYLLFTLGFGGTVDAKTFGAYLGFIFIGAAYLSIGIFASSMTENQVISAILTFGIIFMLVLLDGVASIISSVLSTFIDKINFFGLTDLQIDSVSTKISEIIRWPNPSTRLTGFGSGIFELTPIVYFISLISIFLFLTIRVIEKRRWTQK